MALLQFLYSIVTNIHFYVAIILLYSMYVSRVRNIKMFKLMLINYKAVDKKIEKNTKSTLDLVHNNIEIHLTNVATRFIAFTGDQEYIEEFKRFAFHQDISAISKFYLMYRGEPTYESLVTKLESRRRQYKNAQIVSHFMGDNARTLLYKFKYLVYDKNTKSYSLKSYPYFFIEKLELSVYKAEESLLSILKTYGAEELNIGIFRSHVIEAYTNKVSSWVNIVIDMIQHMESEYSTGVNIQDLIARNRIKEALDKLSLQSTDVTNYDTLVLIKARYAELTNKELRGETPTSEEWSSLRNSILIYANEKIN